MFLENWERRAYKAEPTPLLVHRSFPVVSAPGGNPSTPVSEPLLSPERTQRDEEILDTGRKMTHDQNSQGLIFWLITSEEQYGIFLQHSWNLQEALGLFLFRVGHSLPFPAQPCSAFAMTPNCLSVPYCQLCHTLVFLTATQILAHSQH